MIIVSLDSLDVRIGNVFSLFLLRLECVCTTNAFKNCLLHNDFFFGQ